MLIFIVYCEVLLHLDYAFVRALARPFGRSFVQGERELMILHGTIPFPLFFGGFWAFGPCMLPSNRSFVRSAIRSFAEGEEPCSCMGTMFLFVGLV